MIKLERTWSTTQNVYNKHMPRKIVLGFIAIVLLAIGFVVIQAKDAEQTTPAPIVNEQATIQEQPQTNSTSTPGTYVNYTPDILSTSKGTRLLFFHAPWCPQCVQLEKSIRAGGIPENVTIIKVDYDTNMKLRQQYGVTLQTTVVRIDENGNAVKKFVAYESPNLAAVKQNLLQ